MERIFVITNPMPQHNNSPAVSLGKFVREICSAGYTPSVIGARLPGGGIPGAPDDIDTVSFRYGGRGLVKKLSYVFLQLRLFSYLVFKLKKGDAVYFWIADKMIGAFFAARLRGSEINYFLYGNIVNSHTPRWAQRMNGYMALHADYVCAEAPSVFGEYEIPENKRLDVIGLFVPETNIPVSPYSDRGPYVGVMSRLSDEKYPLETIRAFLHVHADMPDLKFYIIGGGPLEERCRELIREYNAESYIEMFGWLPSEEAKRRLGECRLLLYPAKSEGVPGGILEAMSLGVPALASPVGGILDVIDDGVDGIYLAGTDEASIAADMKAAIFGGGLEAMSAEAVKKIKDRFSLDEAVCNFKKVRASHGERQ